MDFNVVLRPLKHVEDLQRIIEYLKAIPESIKNRDVHIINLLNQNNSDAHFLVPEISGLMQNLERNLPKFDDNPWIITKDKIDQELSQYMKRGNTDVGLVNIVSPVTKCCGPIKNCSIKVCTVYRSQSKPVVGVMHDMKCQKCNTVYKASTYKKDGTEFYYSDVLDLSYFMSTGDTVFSAEFLTRCDIDIFRKAASFESIAYAYNDEHFGSNWMALGKEALVLDRPRLAEAWYKKVYINTTKRYNMTTNIEYLHSDKIESTLQHFIDEFWTLFTKDWSSENHSNNCQHKECCKALVIDGHMKGTRSVCAKKSCATKKSDELGEVMIGCKQMPVKGSMYCLTHKHNETTNILCEQETVDRDVDDLACKTTKDKGPLNKCKTAGICAAVYNCGVIVGVTELYGSESLSQVYMFLVWLATKMLSFPKLLVYDDACHLKRFVNNPVRADKTQYSKLLATIRMVVDKMHFANHVDKWCRRNVNPYTDDIFKNINTEACEQTFHYISKYKYATKHMSYGKYNLFMLHVCQMYNQDRIIRSSKRCRYVY